MSNFMGPMAPPPAAPGQPPQLDFQTDPNQRQRFKQFMRQRMQPPMQKMPMPAPMPQPMPTVPAGSYILPDMDIFAPQQFYGGGIVGGLNNLGKMSSQMVDQLNQVIYGGGSSGSGISSTRSNFGNIFNNPTQSSDMQANLQQSQMSDMPQNDLESSNLFLNATQPFYGFEDGGSVPPRETSIRGQYHELSYITPDEADILMALGGSGELGPMGIPSYPEPGMGGDSDSRSGSGNEGGSSSGGSSGGGGGGGGNDDSGNESDNASDDEMGDVGIMDGPGYSNNNDADPFAGEEGDDFSTGNYGNDDGSFNASDFVDFGVQEAKDRAIKDAFVTDTSGKPIGTSSGYVTQGTATDAEKAAGYKALGLPDPNSDLASEDVEASYGVPADAIDAVSSGVSNTASDTGLMGFDYDLLNSNIDRAIEARKGLPTQASPLNTSPFNAQNQAAAAAAAAVAPSSNAIETVSSGTPSTANKSGLLGFDYDLLQSIDELSYGPPAQVTSFNDPQFGQITQTTDFDLMGRPTSKTTTSDLANFNKTESYSYGPNQQGLRSNVVSDFSPTPTDQLDAQYGKPDGYFAALDNLVDDDFASIGNRQGPMSDDLANALGVGTSKDNIGYDPVTDLPYGLEFATNPQTGAQITTNLAGLTEQQRENQPLSMDIAQFIGSNPYGYELDPVTGNPIGQVGTAPFGILGGLTTLAQDLITGKPETVQDLIERGAYTGMTGQDGGDDIFGGRGDDDVILPIETVAAVEEVAEDPVIEDQAPASAPQSVVVPSTRQVGDINLRMPVGYGVRETGQINPYVLSELRRYQQMLAKMNRPNSPPVAFAEGGSVLDAAAGRFLESLTAA